jgi:hypothetical protein
MPPADHAASTRSGKTAQFRRSLAQARASRPSAPRPASAALLRWSRSLSQAADAAPDARTRRDLHALARYVQELARTPAAQRLRLESRRPGVKAAAGRLERDLPTRFGVKLLA